MLQAGWRCVNPRCATELSGLCAAARTDCGTIRQVLGFCLWRLPANMGISALYAVGLNITSALNPPKLSDRPNDRQAP